MLIRVVRRRSKNLEVIILLFVSIVLFASSNYALEFSQNPTVYPTNAVTISNLTCGFIANGTGIVKANVTWYKYSAGTWNPWYTNNETINITNNVFVNTNSTGIILNTSTSKNQRWKCSVQLYNETDTIPYLNSSYRLINNSKPVITSPLPQTNYSVYEDSETTFQAFASDPDGDNILWISIDLNASEYGGNSLFSITGQTGETASKTFTPTASYVGNHTISIIAQDSVEGSLTNIVFEVLFVNDTPIFDAEPYSFSCTEGIACSGDITATDEEGDTLVYSANDSLIDINSTTGHFSFVPSVINVGNHTIQVNVTDGNSIASTNITVEISGVNHQPYLIYFENTSGVQNQTSNYTFVVIANDSDINDTLRFNISSNCDLTNPWTINTTDNATNKVNGTGIINVSFSNSIFNSNDFVVCRNVTISVTDYDEANPNGKLTDSQNILLNITNSNDAPIIYDISTYSVNIGSQTNISNLSGAQGVDFTYRVNATDIDNLTYEGETFNFTLNDSTFFSINLTTGIVRSVITPDGTYIGNHSILVTVTDDEGLNYSSVMNIEIVNNFAPIFNSFDNSTCVEDSLCQRFVSGNDSDTDEILSFDILNATYVNPLGDITTMSELGIETLFNISFVSDNANTTTYRIRFTPDNSEVGNYTFVVYFEDDLGVSFNRTLRLIINNSDDNPKLDEDGNSATDENISFGTIVDGFSFNKTIYTFDDDTYYGLDTLTVNYTFLVGDLNWTFRQINSSELHINFTPNTIMVGNYSVLIYVNDSTGNSDSQIINFTILNQSIAPTIIQIRPYANSTNTTDAYINTTNYPTSEVTIFVDENSSQTFYVNVSDPDSIDENISIYWYINGTLNYSTTYDNSNSNILTFDFLSERTLNLTVVVIDERYSQDSFSWIINVTNVNRAPEFMNYLYNMTLANGREIDGTETIIDFFRLETVSPVFLDYDDDLNENGYYDNSEELSLTFSLLSGSACEDYATFSFSNGDVTITPEQTGSCNATFLAVDDFGENITSNPIRIEIIGLPEDPTTTTTTSGSTTNTVTVTTPYQEDIDVPIPLHILAPGTITMYEDGAMTVPITVSNDWTETISNIEFFGNISHENVTFEFSQNVISELAEGESMDINVTLTNYHVLGPYSLNVTAIVESLDFQDSVTIHVNALERGLEDINSIESKIAFTRDLLNDNPECQELIEILDNAELIAKTDGEQALKIINSVINGCKYLVSQSKKAETNNPKSFLGKLGIKDEKYDNYVVVSIAFIAVLSIAFFIGGFVKRKMQDI